MVDCLMPKDQLKVVSTRMFVVGTSIGMMGLGQTCFRLAFVGSRRSRTEESTGETVISA